MKKGLLFILLTLSFTLKAKVDVNMQALYWSSAPKSNFGEASNSKINLSNESQQQTNLTLGLEHVLPLALNFKIQQSTSEGSGAVLLDKTYRLDDTIYKVATELSGSQKLKQLDAVFYYALYNNNLVELDLGIVGREHHIRLDISDKDSSSSASSRSVKSLVPMLYVASELNLNLLRFGIRAEAKWHSANDYENQFLGYYRVIDNSLISTEVIFGWREMKLDMQGFSGLYFEQYDKSLFSGIRVEF